MISFALMLLLLFGMCVAPKRGKDLYVSGRKVEIVPLEEFKVVWADSKLCSCDACSWYVNEKPEYVYGCRGRWKSAHQGPLIDVYVELVLEGLLLRGIVG